MDYKTFIDKVGETAGIDRDTSGELCDALASVIEQALTAGDTVSIPSFGNFEPRKRNERVMSNPSQPGKRLLVPPKVIVSFKPSAILKNKINKTEGDE